MTLLESQRKARWCFHLGNANNSMLGLLNEAHEYSKDRSETPLYVVKDRKKNVRPQSLVMFGFRNSMLF
jgi:hypothetical protein